MVFLTDESRHMWGTRTGISGLAHKWTEPEVRSVVQATLQAFWRGHFNNLNIHFIFISQTA